MDVIVAYREVGTFRGAAEMCGTTHRTVGRIVESRGADGGPSRRAERAHNYDVVRDVVACRVGNTRCRISAKRLLVEARSSQLVSRAGRPRSSLGPRGCVRVCGE